MLEAMAHRLLRRMVEHLEERMGCKETQLEARAEDMRELVTKPVEMALIHVQPKNHGDGSAEAPQFAAKAVRGRDRRGGKRGRRAEGAPDGTQTREIPADMRAGRVNGVTSKRDSWGRREWGSSVARHKD